jgi:hypothetical protein
LTGSPDARAGEMIDLGGFGVSYFHYIRLWQRAKYKIDNQPAAGTADEAVYT